MVQQEDKRAARGATRGQGEAGILSNAPILGFGSDAAIVDNTVVSILAAM
jgi:hypothetical protein